MLRYALCFVCILVARAKVIELTDETLEEAV